jgi:hypothetical protein
MLVQYGGRTTVSQRPRSGGRRRSLALLLGALMTISAFGATAPSGAEPGEPPLPPGASFTWNLTRYHDRGGDALPDPARTPEEAQPAEFLVSLDGCGSSPAPWQVSRYVWNLNGSVTSTNSCDTTWMAPGEGSFPVSLTVETPDGNSDAITQVVTVEDLVVVSIGDSLGSGQGNPHTPKDGNTPAVWEDQRCHRSEIAASAQAARALETENPKTSITFVHLACSGAKISDPEPTQGGLLDGYQGQDPAFTGPKGPAPLPPQLDEVERLIGDRKIDVLLLSVGINDVEFASIVLDCINPLKPRCDRRQRHVFERNLRLLSAENGTGGRYADLAGALAARFPELALDPSKVFINEYPDPTHSGGVVCPSMLAGQITRDEVAWASTVVPELNKRVHAAAGIHRWTTVDGVREQYLFNGECNNDDHWFVQAHESLWNQGNEFGTLHPNAKGHAPLRDRFLDTVRPKLPPAPPGIVVNGLAPGRALVPGEAPTVFFHDPVGVRTSSLTLDGAPYASGTPVNAAGAHTLVAQATNNAGLQSSLTIPFTVVPSSFTVTVSPGTVPGGTTAIATVQLAEEAPYPGIDVALSSSRPDVASVAASVKVATGAKTGVAVVTASPVAADTPVTITASAAGLTRTANLVVSAPGVKSVALIPDQVAGGDPAKARVFLTTPAPAGGISVSLTSANPSVVVVPASWAVPANQTFVDVPISTMVVTSETPVVVSATLGATAQATLRVYPRTVVVPLVQDINGVVAARILLDMGFEVVQLPAELNGNVNAHVIEQAPAAGTTVAFGSTVTLTLRLGPVQ